MSYFLCVRSCALLLAGAALALSGPALLAQAVHRATPGEAATGEVVSETAQEIRVRTKPCDASSQVVIFIRPYSREAAGTVKCGAVEKALVQVVQR
jgi:hypothetical protein